MSVRKAKKSTTETKAAATVGTLLDEALAAFAGRRAELSETLEQDRKALAELQGKVSAAESALAVIDAEQAKAVAVFLRENRLIAPETRQSRRGGSRGGRLSKEQLTEAVGKVTGMLAGGDTHTRSAIAEQTGLDVKVANRAIWKLYREGKITNNGARGAKCGWKLVA